MNHVTYTIGQGFDASNKPLDNVAERRASALRDIATHFGGYTARDSQGGWIGPDGTLVTEPSLIVDVVTDASASAIHDEATYLARAFNQQAVMLTESPITADFVGQEETKAA